MSNLYIYRCKHCGYILEREFKQAYIVSFCYKVMKPCRPKLITDANTN